MPQLSLYLVDTLFWIYITTYVSSLLEVQTVVPTEKKEVRKSDEQIKQL